MAHDGDSLFPVAGGPRQTPVGRRPEDAESQDEADERPPGHAYTWLHYLILIAVAFVLGLLIWKLLLGEGASAAESVVPAELLASSAGITHVGLSS